MSGSKVSQLWCCAMWWQIRCAFVPTILPQSKKTMYISSDWDAIKWHDRKRWAGRATPTSNPSSCPPASKNDTRRLGGWIQLVVPFLPGILYILAREIPSELKWTEFKPNETRKNNWNQMKSLDAEWHQVKPSESMWNPIKEFAPIWSSETNWTQWNGRQSKLFNS